MDALVEHANHGKLAVFVGAGVSMLPPASLPSWYELNRMTLTALAARIGDYIHSPGFADRTLASLIERRDHTDCFAPDYQAQLMVEEAGDDYFRVFEALDTEAFNPCHDGVAAMAAAGKLKVVLTTNFDRLCEVALEARDVPYRVYSDQDDFATLRRGYGLADELDHVPVIKIHGSVDNPGSMVDTLQQRLRGRGEDLERILEHLLRGYHWLFLGFSGADFDYEPNYLSLRKGIDGGLGFSFLVRSGAKPRSSVEKLIDDYGGRARALYGDLPEWLLEFLRAVEVRRAPSVAGRVAERPATTTNERIVAWAASLDNMQTINLFAGLLFGADENIDTYRFLRLVWRHYRRFEDCRGSSYGRFCQQFGKRLLEHGVTPSENWEGAIRSTLIIGDDIGDRDDAFQFLARAKKEFKIEEATPHLALALAYRGDLDNAERGLSESFRHAAETGSGAGWSDGVYAAGIIRYLQRNWSGGATILVESFRAISWDGDEPRRARYDAWLGAYLAWRGAKDKAEEVIREGLSVSESLGLTLTKGDNLWALGVLETERRNGKASFEYFHAAWRIFEKNELRPRLIFTFLEAARSITLPTTDPRFNEWAVDQFLDMRKRVDQLLEDKRLIGFLPSYSLANFYFAWNMSDLAREEGDAVAYLREAEHNLADAREFGTHQRNHGAVEAARREEPDLLAELKRRGLSPNPSLQADRYRER